MEEESKLHLIEPLSEESGKHHEMVIMNPHIVIIWANDLHDFVSENLVDRDIGLPVLAVEAAAMIRAEGKQVVEKRPQHLLAKPMIESGPEVLGEESRHTIEILKKSGSMCATMSIRFSSERTEASVLTLPSCCVVDDLLSSSRLSLHIPGGDVATLVIRAPPPVLLIPPPMPGSAETVVSPVRSSKLLYDLDAISRTYFFLLRSLSSSYMCFSLFFRIDSSSSTSSSPSVFFPLLLFLLLAFFASFFYADQLRARLA